MTDPLDPRGLEAAVKSLIEFPEVNARAIVKRAIEVYLAASRENASPSEHRCVRTYWGGYVDGLGHTYTAECSCGTTVAGPTEPELTNAFAEHVLAASPRRENASAPSEHHNG